MPDRSTVRLAAQTFIALSLVVTGFQLALVAGAPWGELTMGGAFPGRLPPGMRGVAAVSAVVLLAFSAIVAARAGLALPRWQRAASKLIWVVVAYSVVAVALNAATPSARERMLWLPVTVMLAVCSVVVARAGDRISTG
jgi:hypothetical protein